MLARRRAQLAAGVAAGAFAGVLGVLAVLDDPESDELLPDPPLDPLARLSVR